MFKNIDDLQEENEDQDSNLRLSLLEDLIVDKKQSTHYFPAELIDL
jgi:hypothetical protein